MQTALDSPTDAAAELSALHQRIAALEAIAAMHAQTAAALQENQRRLDTLFSNLFGMAYRCRNDPDWTMEFVSEGCLELTGYPPAALMDNHTIAYRNLIHPGDQTMVWEQVQAALHEHSSFRMLYRIHPAQGGERWVMEQGRGGLG